ncbi:hypothetical protein [Mycolicibacterium diernhoferi]|uniref:hypothetical protein n=1 Tax=Mycolicibacterium diernhoferi TaxID=1801 RepID=UPI001FD2A53F|nr:hypothetical protein [Mycolicibacterium diernhoferi]
MIGRVALTALELPDQQRTFDAVTAQITGQGRIVEAVLREDVDEFGDTGHPGSVSHPFTGPTLICARDLREPLTDLRP